MLTSADGNTIRIEKDGYAPVVVHKIQAKYTYFENVASITDTAERARGGSYLETFLPDGTVVESFTDYLTQDLIGVRHLYKRSDFTVISVNSNGQVDIVSSNARSTLNEIFDKQSIGKDSAYC
jgi:hypothetical protein